MKLIEFVYTKDTGKQSSRAIIELSQPSKFVEGIDISELDTNEFAAFCQEFGELKRKQYEETMQVLTKFDLKHNYRRFDPSKMTDIAVDHV